MKTSLKIPVQETLWEEEAASSSNILSFEPSSFGKDEEKLATIVANLSPISKTLGSGTDIGAVIVSILRIPSTFITR